jgi:hypothetical protein
MALATALSLTKIKIEKRSNVAFFTRNTNYKKDNEKDKVQ